MKKKEQLNKIANQIRAFYRTLKKEFNQILESEGMTNGEFLMLRSILNNCENSKDMAAILGVSLPYITSLSDKMLEKGYIERKQSEQDRRRVVIQITGEGKKKFNKLDTKIQKYLEARFNKLTDEELEIFEKLLRKVDNI